MVRRGKPVFAVLVIALLLAPTASGVTQTADSVTLTVAVVDTTDNPVSSAELNVSWDGGSATETTAGNGKAFVDVPAGANVTIAVAHPDYVRNFDYTLTNATERDVEVRVAPNGRLAVDVETPQGTAVQGAQVTVARDGRTVVSGTTASNGRLQTGIIEQGTYRVHIVKRGYVSNATRVTVNESTTTTLVTSQASVLLEVTVRDDHFDPPRRIDNVTVSIGDVATVRAATGTATASVPVNARYTVSLSKPGYTSVDAGVPIAESSKNVTLMMNRAPSLSLSAANERVVVGERVRVTVVDEYGAPVSNATVLVDGDARGETDGSGVAAVTIEQAGPNQLAARKGNLQSETLNVTGVSAGDSTTATTPEPTTTATPTETTTTTSRFGPGFGLVSALVALAVVGFARRMIQ